jgi:hypothetical protein
VPAQEAALAHAHAAVSSLAQPVPDALHPVRSPGPAQVVRRSLKQEFQAKATLRDVSHMKVIEYDAGKPKKVRKCPSMMTRLHELTFTYDLRKGCERSVYLCDALDQCYFLSPARRPYFFLPSSANFPHAYCERPFFRPSFYTANVRLSFLSPVHARARGERCVRFASLGRLFSLSEKGMMGEAAVKSN